MTAHQMKKRQKTVVWLGALVAASWGLLGILSLASDGSTNEHGRMGDPVLADFAGDRADIGSIEFTLADGAYTLVRSEDGWIMPDSGGYPTRRDRMANLATGLETLRYDIRRTRDPYKLEQIGLGDPSEGGNGALIELFRTDGSLYDALIVGRKDEAIYVRDPDSSQTYRTSGDLPPFYNRRGWLDLDILSIDPSAISSVRLIDAGGNSLYLRRPTGGDNRSFRPAPPNETDTLLSALAASTTALAITRLTPLDVRPASDLRGAPVARHISETFDGLEVDLKAYRQPDGVYVTLRAVEAGEGARRAEAINEKAEGWAFRIAEYDWQDFTPPLSTLVRRNR